MKELNQLEHNSRSTETSSEEAHEYTRVANAATRPPLAEADCLGQDEAGSPASVGEGSILSRRYLLTKRLASGGTCDVYQARDLVALGVAGDQSFLALKVLRDDVVQAVGDAGLVLNEALLTRKLNHPSIIKIFDYHCDQEGSADRHFVTMELVEGETLADLLARTPGRQLSYWHAMAILEPVASALQAAHEKGIIHSDVKPGNILIGHDGQVKVIDFGTARGLMHALKRKPWRKGRQTLHDAQEADVMRSYLAFTHEYASQDVINDEPPAQEDDVYALACVLYEALSGQKPKASTPSDHPPDNQGLAAAAAGEEASNGADDAAALTANHPGGLPQSLFTPSKLRRPSVLNFAQWRVLKKGLAAQKRHRYHSVAEFIEAFKRARTRPKKVLMLMIFLPLAIFGLVEAQQQYAAHRATIETWAQSDLQLVQATQYADVLAQAPVESLPRVLAELTGLPDLLQAGVLATSAEPTLVRLGNHANDRLAYNALALSEIGVKVDPPGAELKHLQRTNAELVNYEGLLTLIGTVDRYFPDSARLTAIKTQVEQAKNQEISALRARWVQLWNGDFSPSAIENLFAVWRRVVAIGADKLPLDTDTNRPLFDLPEGALARYQQAVKTAIEGTDQGIVRDLKRLVLLFGEGHATSEAMAAIWQPYVERVLKSDASEKAVAKQAAPQDKASSIESQAEQQAVISVQLLYVANVWRDVDLMAAPQKLRTALETVNLDLKSAAAEPLVSALIERIELKISYYHNTDQTVSTRRLEALRDQLAGL